MSTSRTVRSLAAVALAASAVMFTMSTDPAPVAPAAVHVEEDSPGWNCLTMGNRVCGPAFVPVSQDLGDALAEGDDPAATTRDWESCMVNEGDTTFIVCPDGFVETS